MCGGGLTCIILLALVIGELLAECTFHLNQHVPKTPILIQNAATPPEILYPKQMDVIKLQTGAKFKLTCVDKYFSKNFNKSNKFKDLLLRCNKGDFVEVQRERVRFRDLECEDFPASTVQKNTRKRCYNNSTLFDIGFRIGDRKFLNVIHACFDQLNQDSVYTWYENSKLNLGHQSKVRRPNFAHDNLYTFPNYKVYNSKYQKRRFARIFNSTELAEKYIKDDGRYFLSRGHLSPKADFVYGSEQSATFHYINVAPQWQVFNEGNWQLLEDSVRKEIKKKEKRYRVVTGTYGVATLPDVNNNEKELYLHVDENNNPLLKVPKYYWKIIYDMNRNSGVTIIGINNPYLKDVPQDYIICRDICHKITWLPEFSDNLSKGYIYCCDMNEFLKVTGIDTAFINDEKKS